MQIITNKNIYIFLIGGPTRI